MNYPQNRHSNKSSKKMISDHDDLLNSNKRELIYYIHYLQKNRKWRGYISDLNYNNIKDVIKQLENAISKVIRQEGDINDFTERMLKEYHENSIRESEFEWLRNDERACFWLLFVMLNNRGNSQDLSAIEKTIYLIFNLALFTILLLLGLISLLIHVLPEVVEAIMRKN